MDNLKEQLLRVVRLEEVVERYLPLGRTGSARHTLVGSAFCGRLIFPIRSEAGELVAFAGRYRGELDLAIAKYVNSPTTAVYQKDHLLYGLYRAKAAIAQHGFVYITEGYKDVLAMHATGFEHTVALCGTALTAHHAALLKRYTHRAVLMLDGDRAGEEGSRRAASLLHAAGITVSYLALAPDEDPDSLLHRLGTEKFAATIRRLTNICRLETYEQQLVHRLEATCSDLALALSVEDRQRMLRDLMPIRARLGKVTKRLGRNVVAKKI